MKRITTFLLATVLLLSLTVSCNKEEPVSSADGNITYVPYDVDWETVRIGIFGDGIITANSFGDLVRLFAETDGFNIDFITAAYDNTGKAGSTSGYNLYETMVWKTKYTSASGLSFSSANVSRLTNAMSESSVDYFIIDTGRDRNILSSDYFADASTIAAVAWEEYYKEHCPDGKIVLLAPPSYQTGSKAFNTEYKVGENTYNSISQRTTTRAGHTELIKDYAQQVGEALGSDVTYSYMCDAFDFFYENYSDSNINLYQDDLTFTSAAGSYYMAAVLYGSLFGKSTVGMPVYGYLDGETAKILQNAAHDYLFDTEPSSVKRSVNYVKCLATVEDVDQSNKIPSADCYANEVYGENYSVLLATAYSFYARGNLIQYDNIHNSNTYKALLRRDVETRAEDATPQNLSYLDCSSFVYSVYNNAFGYNFGGATDTVQFLKRDKDRVFYWSKSTTSLTDEAAVEALLNTLQPGDVIVYTGHAMLYMGNGMIMHCMSSQETSTSANYNVDSGIDSKEIFGGIIFESIDCFTKPTGYRYSFVANTEIAIYRPLSSVKAPTEEGVTRAEGMSGITAYKTTTAPDGITVNSGDSVTITFTVKNDSEKSKKVTLTDTLAEGLTYVSGDFKNDSGSLSATVDIPAGKTKAVSYTVSVNADVKPATVITCDGAKANGILLNTTHINVMPTLSAEDMAKISEAAKAASAETTAEMIVSVYNTLGKKLSFTDAGSLFKQLLSVTSSQSSALYVYTEDEEGYYNETYFTNKLIPYNLYGGKHFSALSGPYTYIKNPTVDNILPGDILLLSEDAKAQNITLYLCTEAGVLAEIKDGSYTEYRGIKADELMESVFKYSYFCVARPSMCNRICE